MSARRPRTARIAAATVAALVLGIGLASTADAVPTKIVPRTVSLG